MARRLLIAFLLLLLVGTAPAAADNAQDRKRAVDEKISRLNSKISSARARERSLQAQIASVSAKIRTLEAEVGDVGRDLAVLEQDLALQQEKLDRITELFRLQSTKLRFLREQHAAAIDRLNDRLVAAYQAGDVDGVAVVLSAESFSDLLSRLDYVKRVAAQDREIAGEVGVAKDEMRVQRERTKKTRAKVAAVHRAVLIRTEQQRSIRNQLVSSRNALAGARNSKEASLQSVEEQKAQLIAEADALARVSAQLAGRIQYSQRTSPVVRSSGGLIWPVSGPVSSPFGMRWGRLHAGIDIAAPTGSPIRAAASGLVIYSGWMGGYGNLVVIDHGGGLATAYAHNSSNAVANGQRVGQGQVIAAVGCTGHCFGPHVHFEVRVNGSPVDPLGYL